MRGLIGNSRKDPQVSRRHRFFDSPKVHPSPQKPKSSPYGLPPAGKPGSLSSRYVSTKGTSHHTPRKALVEWTPTGTAKESTKENSQILKSSSVECMSTKKPRKRTDEMPKCFTTTSVESTSDTSRNKVYRQPEKSKPSPTNDRHSGSSFIILDYDCSPVRKWGKTVSCSNLTRTDLNKPLQDQEDHTNNRRFNRRRSSSFNDANIDVLSGYGRFKEGLGPDTHKQSKSRHLNRNTPDDDNGTYWGHF